METIACESAAAATSAAARSASAVCWWRPAHGSGERPKRRRDEYVHGFPFQSGPPARGEQGLREIGHRLPPEAAPLEIGGHLGVLAGRQRVRVELDEHP